METRDVSENFWNTDANMFFETKEKYFERKYLIFLFANLKMWILKNNILLTI